MPPYAIALIFLPLSALSIWSILRAVRNGTIRDEGMYTFTAEDNPIGFSLTIMARCAIPVFFVAEALYAMGVIGDPLAYMRHLFDFTGGGRTG